MLAERLCAVAFLAVAVVGCVDEPVAVAPTGGVVVLAPQFSFHGASAGLPIEVIRLRPMLVAGGPLGEPYDARVTPTEARWSIRLPIDLGERDSATILVEIEMLSRASGSEIVEWSGIVGPVHVRADAESPVQTPAQMFRGPLENGLVDSLYISGPSQLLAGQVHSLYAYVQTRGTSHTVLWTSSDPAVLTVDPVGDSVQVHATGAGTAMIVAAAGMWADTLTIFVDATTVGPVARVLAYPDSAVVVLGTTRAWQAYAFDAQEIPVSATFTWVSLDPGIATVNAAGIVTGQALGRARIVASASGFADTAIAKVEPLPEGVDLVWQGGTPGAEEDWFTADNWSPAQVPGASSVIYLASTPWDISLTGNASVGGILSDSLGAYLYVGSNTLTAHGDVRLGYNGIYGDAGSRLVVDAPVAAIAGSLPATTLLGATTSVGNVFIEGDLLVDGTSRPAYLDIPVQLVVAVYGDTRLTNAHFVMREDSTFDISYFYAQGDLTIDGGDSSNSLTGGVIVVEGDFTVNATTCTAFRPNGTEVELYSDSSRISLGCSGRTGNRFSNLWIYSSTSAERLIYLDTDISVTRELYMDGGVGTRIIGNGVTIDAAAGSAWAVTLDHVFLEVDLGLPDATFWMDSLTFTGMTGETRPQLRYLHPGDPCACYSYHHVLFDPTSAGPYIEAIDAVQDAATLVLYMAHNPGDGPQRTVTAGGAQVHWADVAYHMFHWAGSGQSGPPYQPLPDSLAAQVVDFGFYPVAGVAVDWTVIEGDGSVSPASSTTDANGVASTQFTVGDTIYLSHTVMATTAAVPADTIYFGASAFGVPGGSTAATVVPILAQARTTSGEEAVRARVAEPARREATPRPERPAARPERISNGERP